MILKREESFDLMTIIGWMAPASLTKPEREFTENEKRGNHLRPQSTAEKNLNSALGASNNTNTSSTVCSTTVVIF